LLEVLPLKREKWTPTLEKQRYSSVNG
jgi:hypothetical protein